jgi:hypothetical protein
MRLPSGAFHRMSQVKLDSDMTGRHTCDAPRALERTWIYPRDEHSLLQARLGLGHRRWTLTPRIQDPEVLLVRPAIKATRVSPARAPGLLPSVISDQAGTSRPGESLTRTDSR